MEETQNTQTDGGIIAESLTVPERFGVLYERHFRRLHRYINRRVGSELADELTSETFARAFDARHKFDLGKDDAAPWLFGIASNLIRMHARTEVRMLRAYSRTSIQNELDFTEAADSRIDADLQARTLSIALTDLSKGEREVVLLHAWGGLSLVEVAEALSIPEGTVRSRLSRARQIFTRALTTATTPASAGRT